MQNRTPSPFNHLPDSLSLTLKVLKRYKREGRALTADETSLLSAIADEVRSFGVVSGSAGTDSSLTASTPTTTITLNSNTVISNRLNAALAHAAASLTPPDSALVKNVHNTTTTSPLHTPKVTARDAQQVIGSPIASSISNTNNNNNPNLSSTGHLSPSSEPARVRDLISKLRRAADSGEVFKELMVKSATVDSLVEFAVECNKASHSREALAAVIVHGVKALAGAAPLPSRPASASHLSTSRKPNGSESPKAASTTSTAPNMRLFLLNKSNEVLEDPLSGEMIGGVSASAAAADGNPNKPRSSPSMVAAADSTAVVGGGGGERLLSTPAIVPLATCVTANSGASASSVDAAAAAVATAVPAAVAFQSPHHTLLRSRNSSISEDQARLAKVVNDITETFSGGSSADAVVKGPHLYLPMTVDGECLGVLAIFDFASAIDAVNKMHVLAACQSIAALSIRNVGLLEDVGYQMSKANAMLRMANQLASDNLDERTLSQSIIVTAKQLIDADRCSIFVVKGATLQAYFEDGTTVIISNQSGIAGHVARTGETVNIVEAYEDSRFNPSVDKATGYRTKTILCMPIRFGDQIVGVAQLINKNPLMVKKGESQVVRGSAEKPTIAQWEIERPFSSRDEELFSTFSTFVGVSLRNCRINQGLQVETEKSKAILDVVAMLSQTDIRDVNNIASHVMAGAKKLLHADRSTLFLVDKENHELYSEVADNNTTGSELRVPFGTGIAGKVASTQLAENIVDAYKHPDFDPSVDKALGYSTYSILCEPIVYHNEVLAVAQLMNKVDLTANNSSDNNAEAQYTAFTERDQETFRTFAMFAGISISNAHMLRFAVEAGNELLTLNARIEGNDLSMESSMYSVDQPFSASVHGRPMTKRRASDVGKRRVHSSERQAILDALAVLNSSPEVDVTSLGFDLFTVRAKASNPSDMGCAVVLKIFQQTGFLDLFQVETETFLNFLCQCRRLYRKVPYHNFFHVVDACQTIYTFLYRGGIREMLSDWECFTLLVTALVHDLDHMGVNNSFHLKTDSPLGILSSATGNTSVLEVHHCNLAIDLLTDPSSNIFSGMDDKTRSSAVKAMIECVLATDMARHHEFLAKFESVTSGGAVGEEGGLNLEDESHRKLVMDLVMKAADISNVTKPFELSRLWAVAVTEEFYRQGDEERARGVEVLPQFDRSKKTELAKGQIGFINFVCEKFFSVMASDNAFPAMRWALENLMKNKQEWTEILNGTTRRPSLIDLSAATSPRTPPPSVPSGNTLVAPVTLLGSDVK